MTHVVPATDVAPPRKNGRLRAALVVAVVTLLLGGVFAVNSSASAQTRAVTTHASGTVVTLVPNRIADSRTGESFDTFSAAEEQDLQVAGRGGVPLTGVGAVLLNVTAVNPQDDGFLTVWPLGYGRPDTSNVNFYARHNIANTVIVQLSSDGTISLYNGSHGDLDVLVDVEGYIPA